MAKTIVRFPDGQVFAKMFIVGRHPSCDKRLDSLRVSRQHAVCTPDEDGMLEVRDLGSTNGIRIDGQRVERGRVRAGNELSIAHVRFRFKSGGEGLLLAWNPDEDAEPPGPDAQPSPEAPAGPGAPQPSLAPPVDPLLGLQMQLTAALAAVAEMPLGAEIIIKVIQEDVRRVAEVVTSDDAAVVDEEPPQVASNDPPLIQEA